MALLSRIKTWGAEVLTPSELNAEFDNIINNGLATDKIVGISADVAAMQAVTDPGEVGTESLASDIAGELKRLRNMVKEITGQAQWYVTPTDSLVDIAALNNPVGTINQFYTFNGAVSIPRRWMICNGDVVNLAAYEAIHGAGTFATDAVGSAALDALNLPDMTSRYPIGVAATTQDGSIAITAVGNSGNTINISHTHDVPAHSHMIYDADGAAGNASGFEGGGASTGVLATGTSGSGLEVGNAARVDEDLYTDIKSAVGTNSKLSATQNIQPDSIEMIYIIRVA